MVNIFLSTVSAEFRSYRDALRHYLDRPNVTVKTQEDFMATGTETMEMLDEYIRKCHVVIHLVGDMGCNRKCDWRRCEVVGGGIRH
jgi:hypothetical protein